MNARGAVVGLLLAGLGVLALGSMTPSAQSTVRTAERAVRIEVVPTYVSNASAVYATREPGRERARF
jgi:hypothetical protein